MAGGLIALLDDVSLIVKYTAARGGALATMSGKTALHSVGVVIDDTAMAPGFVADASPQRELPIIWRITKGSLFNKIIIVLPIALLLSWLAPGLLTPLLMLGGTYLCYEGAQKVVSAITGRDAEELPAQETGPDAEDALVKSAVMTDLILSAEIMVLSLNAVIDQPFGIRVGVLIGTAILITLGVYGVVALLVKIDDIGLAIVEHGRVPALGRGLVRGMPIILTILEVVGTFAMMWVGGHLVLAGIGSLLWSWPLETISHLEHAAAAAAGAAGGFVGWLVETLCSLAAGIVWGLIVYGIIEGVQALLPNTKPDGAHIATKVTKNVPLPPGAGRPRAPQS